MTTYVSARKEDFCIVISTDDIKFYPIVAWEVSQSRGALALPIFAATPKPTGKQCLIFTKCRHLLVNLDFCLDSTTNEFLNSKVCGPKEPTIKGLQQEYASLMASLPRSLHGSDAIYERVQNFLRDLIRTSETQNITKAA